MTRLVAALAEIARRREVARAATVGPWSSTRLLLRNGYPGVVVSSESTGRFVIADRDREARLEDGQFIAANDPTHILAVLDAAEATLRRHWSDPESGDYCYRCEVLAWPCPDAADVLDLYAP